MSLVLDHNGRAYSYDIDNDKLSDAINCDFIIIKIINRLKKSYALSIDGLIYQISLIPITSVSLISLHFLLLILCTISNANYFIYYLTITLYTVCRIL